jgi:hypothetical protein
MANSSFPHIKKLVIILGANLSMKEGCLFVCLFCFVLMRITKPRCFRLCSWSHWKALEEEGRMGLVP